MYRHYCRAYFGATYAVDYRASGLDELPMLFVSRAFDESTFVKVRQFLRFFDTELDSYRSK